MLQNELKYDSCATALDCYLRLTRDLSKNGDDKRTQQLLEYEYTGDARVLQNTVYTTNKTHIGYGTETKNEYDTISNGGKYNHIVFTDRENVPDMKAVPGTMLISEIHGNRDTAEPKILSARLPCACPPCHKNVMDAPHKYEYKHIRSIKEQFIIQNRNQDDNAEDDPLGLQSLTVAQLKSELAARGLTKGGNKPVLISQLSEPIASNNGEPENHDEEEEDIENYNHHMTTMALDNML